MKKAKYNTPNLEVGMVIEDRLSIVVDSGI